MDKFVRILAKQNPTMTLQCKHKVCMKESRIKTADFFSAKPSYRYVCPYCGEATVYNNIEQELINLKKDFKKKGVVW